MTNQDGGYPETADRSFHTPTLDPKSAATTNREQHPLLTDMAAQTAIGVSNNVPDKNSYDANQWKISTQF